MIMTICVNVFQHLLIERILFCYDIREHVGLYPRKTPSFNRGWNAEFVMLCNTLVLLDVVLKCARRYLILHLNLKPNSYINVKTVFNRIVILSEKL
jgi:hypothetical protein